MTKTGYALRAYYNKAKKMTQVRIKMDMARKQAIMASKWMFVLADQNYGEGEVLMFWFRRNAEGRLKMLVDRIMLGAFGLGTDKHLHLLDLALGLLNSGMESRVVAHVCRSYLL